jgi:serine/threonine protein kinase
VNPGDTIGHYRIIEPLGKGGMGEVFLAEDTKLHRRVALKILPRLFAADPDYRERFRREAQAVAALNHPGIVTIHSVEEHDGHLFLTMELVDGGPLSEAIPKGGLPLQKLLRIAIEVADAMAAAQQRGITHRDVKPGNIMLTAAGRAKVLDFGLAKVHDATAGGAGDDMTRMSSASEATGEGSARRHRQSGHVLARSDAARLHARVHPARHARSDGGKPGWQQRAHARAFPGPG